MSKFYNTTQEIGESLKACKRAVNKQEKEVLVEFEKVIAMYPSLNNVMSPSEVHEKLPQCPITSIRRAITNLTEAGYLRKTNVKIISPWGRREHCWELIGD